jgi:hypothetical protein
MSTSILLFSLFWISWLLKLGLIVFPKCHYEFTALRCIIYQAEHRSDMLWQCRPWFCSAWSGSERSVLLHSGWAFHKWIYDDFTYMSSKFKEKPSSCSQVNTVYYAGIQQLVYCWDKYFSCSGKYVEK